LHLITIIGEAIWKPQSKIVKQAWNVQTVALKTMQEAFFVLNAEVNYPVKTTAKKLQPARLAVILPTAITNSVAYRNRYPRTLYRRSQTSYANALA
jgi:hypothetical protein